MKHIVLWPFPDVKPRTAGHYLAGHGRVCDLWWDGENWKVKDRPESCLTERVKWWGDPDQLMDGASVQLVDNYKHCNHHHEPTPDHEIVDFGDGPFVANKAAIPLLRALNEAGIRTRTHHWDGKGCGFIGVLMDNVTIEVRLVNEAQADRTRYDGKMELLIGWEKRGSV